MHKNFKKIVIFGASLILFLLFVYLYYEVKYQPFVPSPPKSNYRIPSSDSTSFYNAYHYNYENVQRTHLISEKISYHGKYSLINQGYYSPVIIKPLSELKPFTSARFGTWIISGDTSINLKGKLMFQIVDTYNRPKFSKAVSVGYDIPVGKEWNYICGTAELKDYTFSPEDFIKFYFRNEKLSPFFLDETLIIFYE